MDSYSHSGSSRGTDNAPSAGVWPHGTAALEAAPPVRTAPKSNYAYAVGLALVIGWLIATAYAFWHFQLRHTRPFERDGLPMNSRIFEMNELANVLLATRVEKKLAESPEATIAHFWDRDCPCSGFNEAHVRELRHRYGSQRVRFLVVAAKHDAPGVRALAGRAFGGEVDLPAIDVFATTGAVAASPAAMVFDGDNRIHYFGPYSDDAFCSPGSGRFVEAALERLLRGEAPSDDSSRLASGCFCDWKPDAPRHGDSLITANADNLLNGGGGSAPQ